MGIACKGGPTGLPGWFGALFSTFANLTEGGGRGGLKLLRQCPYGGNTFQKGASLVACILYNLAEPFFFLGPKKRMAGSQGCPYGVGHRGRQSGSCLREG